MEMQRLLVATNNPGKMHELRALLSDLNVELVTPKELGLQLSVSENGATYCENARMKAVSFSTASGLISLADDSGLEVDLLDGSPGLHSARYVARPGATDADRRTQLLENLRGLPRPWNARFRAAVAIAVPGGVTTCAEGECRGEIIPEERGSDGFGYDPIFLVEGKGRTMAELSMEEKNRVSHRANAIMKARPDLEKLFPRARRSQGTTA